MPELKIIYLAGFNVEKNSGRTNATRAKAAALAKLVGTSCFRLMYPKGSRYKALQYFYMWLFDFRLLRELAFVGRDTVIIQRQAFFPLTATWLFFRGVPVISELHTEARTEIPLLTKERLEKWLLNLVSYAENYVMRLSHAFIFNHPALQEAVKGKYKKPGIVSYNGADTERFKPLSKDDCRRHLHLDTESRYFLFLGSPVRWRGIEQLAEVFRQPSLAGGKYRLLIVGGGGDAYSIHLKALFDPLSNVLFIPHVPTETAEKYVNAADVCLVPVKKLMTTPGNALKLYDYISCGRPVITQEWVIGYADEVDKYGLGAVTDFNDPARAARELQVFAENADYDHYRSHNRWVAENMVSWEKRMENWIELCKTVLKRNDR